MFKKMKRKLETVFLLLLCGLVADANAANEPNGGGDPFVFVESNGRVVMEVESVETGNGWVEETSISGYTGSGYYRWNGGDLFNKQGQGYTRYYFRISNAGEYRMYLRMNHQSASASDQENDLWTSMDADTWYKTFHPGGAQNNGWDFSTRLEYAHGDYRTPLYQLDAGVHVLFFSGRSQNLKIDRIHLIKSGVSGSTNDGLEESGREIISKSPGTETDLQTTAGISGELKRWHNVMLTFEGPSTSENANPNPFLDYRLTVTFTQGAQTFVVPGYYAADGNAAQTGATGGNIWRAHFVPPTTGTWSYSAEFVTGSNIAISSVAGSPVLLNGNSNGIAEGSFSISETDKNLPDNRARGWLTHDGGSHYPHFVGNGEFLIKGGADAPENFLAYEEFDNTPNNKDLEKTWTPHITDWNDGDPTWRGGKGTGIIGAVNYLAEQGMNAFSFLTMNINGDDKNVFPYRSASDRTRIDVSKTGQWDIVFQHGDRKGMFLHFKTQETENDQLLDGGSLGTERKLYYRELVARFGYHLSLNWNLGEENTNTDAQRKAFADYFKSIDPYNHPVVCHTYPGDWDKVYTPLLSYSTFDGISGQQSPNNIPGLMEEWVGESAYSGRKWMVANDEQGSANAGVVPDANDPTHDTVRKNVIWGTLMNSGWGFEGWGFEFYYGYAYPESDLTCEDFRTRANAWQQAQYALNFFRTFLPYHEMSDSDNFTSNNSAECLAKTGEVYAIYLPNGGSTNLELNGISGSFEVKWYDPRNGGGLQSGSISMVEGGASRSLGDAPNSTGSDWVVLVQNMGDMPPTITVSSFPDGSVNTVYSETVSALGGVGALTWAVTSGSLPSGLSIDSGTGLISGIPTTEGIFAFTVQVEDTEGTTDSQAFSITVGPEIFNFTKTFNPIDDAYLEGGSRKNDSYLKVEPGYRISYLKFDVTGISENVTDARLKMEVSGDATSGGTLRWYEGTSNDWTETTLTAANAPAKGGELDSVSGSQSIGTVVETDMTALVTGDGTYSLVVEMDSGGNDVWFSSSEGGAVPELVVTYDTAPETPTGLTAAALFDAEVELSWSDNSNNEDSFQVQYRESGGTFSDYSSEPADTVSLIVTGLSSETIYDFRVRATGSSGTSAWSNIATAATLAAGSAYGRFEAERYDSASGVNVYTGGSGEKIGSIHSGDWISYSDVNFESGAGGFYASVSSAASGGTISIRLDTLDGKLIGSCFVPSTGGWNSFVEFSAAITGATGIHDVFFVFNGYGDQSLFDIDWFTFTADVSRIAVNAGGGAQSDYIADAYFTGGKTWSTSISMDMSNVTNPAPEIVYQEERYSDFVYTVTDLNPRTGYLVRLHLAENYFNESGKRIFDVLINGKLVLKDFDVFVAAGGKNVAVVEQFSILSDENGVIDMTFISVVDNAKVAGIELIKDHRVIIVTENQ